MRFCEWHSILVSQEEEEMIRIFFWRAIYWRRPKSLFNGYSDIDLFRHMWE